MAARRFGSLAAVLFAGIVLAMVPPLCFGQVNTSAINGTIQDSSGAVIPDATVTLTSVARNVENSTRTNTAGVYAFLNVMPDTYNLTVSKEGFQTFEKTGVLLSVSDIVVVNVTMQVGASSQKVTVEADLASVETATASLGTSIPEQELGALPLNGRNFTLFLSLEPGTSPTNTSHNASGWYHYPFAEFNIPSIQGQSNRSILFMLDGVYDSNAYDNGVNVMPTIDDMNEMKIVSATDQAEFGQVTGGVVNVVTKGGTNEYHGGLWEFLENDDLNARNPFTFTPPYKTPLRQNIFGVNGGGPVLIPKLYHGRNRTFFFASYEGQRNHTAATSLMLVPTADNLQGNLTNTGVLAGSAPIPPVYDPYTTVSNGAGGYTRTQFPGNQIPQSELSPGSLLLAKTFWPAPINTSVSGTNWINPMGEQYNVNQFTGRLDEQLTNKQSVFFRYTWSHYKNPGPDYPEGESANITYDVNWAANYNYAIGPHTMVQAQFGHNVFDYYQTVSMPNESASALDTLVTSLWSPAFYQTVAGYGFGTKSNLLLPFFNIPPYQAWETRNSYAQWSNNWQASGSVSHVRGDHILKAGYIFDTSGTQNFGAGHRIGFDPSNTDNPQSPGNTGYALASFLIAVPYDSTTGPGSAGGYNNTYVMGAYVQDEWKISPKLTLNLGLRWDLSVPGMNYGIYGGQTSDAGFGVMDYTTGQFIMQYKPAACAPPLSVTAGPCMPTPNGALLPNMSVANGKIFKTNWNNLGPRVGLAYRLSNRLTARGAYGRFYDNWSANEEYAYGISWPVPGADEVNGLNTPFVTAPAYPNPLAGSGSGLPAASPFSENGWNKDPNAKNAYSDQWNIGLAFELNPTTVLKTVYVGARTRDLPYGTMADLAPTPGPTAWETRVPYPYISPGFYTEYIGTADYEAFQFSLDKKFHGGLAYLISYTWSKNIDTPDLFDTSYVQQPWNLKADRGLSNMDLPHVLNANLVYQLPFGGQLKTGNRVADTLIRGWQLNGIMRYHSGQPITVSVPGDVANIGFTGWPGYMRPNLVGNPYSSQQTASDWLNRSAFAVPANYTYGTMGRNALRGPDYKRLDASLFREVNITEQKRFQIRVEAFNLTNTTNLGNPDTNLGDTTFGQIFGTSTPARQMQMSLKFLF